MIIEKLMKQAEFTDVEKSIGSGHLLLTGHDYPALPKAGYGRV